MSYTPGTDLGSLRELVGDTSALKEIFDDTYLNAVLSDNANNIGLSAIAVLERLQNDPDLIRQKYEGLGKFGINELIALQRNVGEQIQRVKEGHLSVTATSTTDARFPTASVDIIGQSTDEDKWFEEGDIETYIDDLDDRYT